MVARHYRKGVRLDTHMHREAQLVYAASGTMQVTTPKGRWLVPPDRAVWVPARLEHSIDVLADIEMRTLYFDLAWLAREARSDEPRRGIRGAGVAAAAPRRSSRCSTAATTLTAPRFWSSWPCSNCIRPRTPRPSFRCRTSRAAGAPPTSCSAIPPASHEIETLAREVGTSARTLSRLFSIGDATELQELVPARPHRRRDRKTVDRTPTSRSSNSPPISAMPACRRFRTPSGRSPARRRREFCGDEIRRESSMRQCDSVILRWHTATRVCISLRKMSFERRWMAGASTRRAGSVQATLFEA